MGACRRERKLVTRGSGWTDNLGTANEQAVQQVCLLSVLCACTILQACMRGVCVCVSVWSGGSCLLMRPEIHIYNTHGFFRGTHYLLLKTVCLASGKTCCSFDFKVHLSLSERCLLHA